jgi:FAD/FMN-containing dehydrogenase
MRFVVEVQTIAGRVTVGGFATLEEARAWAGARGLVVPVFPPTVTLEVLQGSWSVERVLEVLEG